MISDENRDARFGIAPLVPRSREVAMALPYFAFVLAFGFSAALVAGLIP